MAVTINTLLAAVSAPGSGTPAALTNPAANHTMQVVPSVASATFRVVFEGSVDGTNYFPIGTATNVNPVVTNNAVVLGNHRATLVSVSSGNVTATSLAV